MAIYLPELADKIKDTIAGLKKNWEAFLAHAAAFEAHKAAFEAHKAASPAEGNDLHGLLSGGFIIEESGSNDNGSWVRFGNGLQICWHHVRSWPESMPDTATGSLYRSSADLVWTYPKPFVDEPYVDGSSSGYSWVADAGGASRDNTESYSFRVYRSMAATVNPHVRLWAIGRWK